MACAVVLLNGDTRDLSWGNALSLLSNRQISYQGWQNLTLSLSYRIRSFGAI